MYSNWEQAATKVEKVYGAFVDWDERFFICPECGEPVYEEDWQGEEYDECPVCGFEF